MQASPRQIPALLKSQKQRWWLLHSRRGRLHSSYRLALIPVKLTTRMPCTGAVYTCTAHILQWDAHDRACMYSVAAEAWTNSSHRCQ